MSDKTRQSGINWGAWLSVPGALAVIIVAVIWVGSIASRVNDNEKDITEAQSESNEAFKQINSLRVELTQVNAAESAIENQFCASDIVRNEEKSGNIRNVALLWKKVFGQIFPTDSVYYAKICQPKTQ